MMILIVDDDPHIREMLIDLLEDEGYPVVGVTNGAEALERLRAGALKPCVILLDLMMPQMNGWQFRQVQLADPALVAIPVIILSAVERLGQEAAALSANTWFPKPIDLDGLLHAIASYCSA